MTTKQAKREEKRLLKKYGCKTMREVRTIIALELKRREDGR